MGTLESDLLQAGQLSTPGQSGALVDSLLGVPLFENIHREEIVDIVAEFDTATFGPGHRVTLQGLRGSDFFVIVDGSAAVIVDDAEIAELGRGDFFGEVGVLSDGLRTATVAATTHLRCLVLPHRGLASLLERHPRLGVNLLREVLDRFRDVSNAASRARQGWTPDR